VAFGVPNAAHASHLHDLNLREMITMAPLVVLVFWIGFYPNPLLVKMHASVNDLIEHVDVGDYEVSRQDAPDATASVPTPSPPVTGNKGGVSMRDYTAVPPFVR
jgi:NADH-quinone oxidoreductase subunit M